MRWWWKLPLVAGAVLVAWFVGHVDVTVGDGLRDDLAQTEVP